MLKSINNTNLLVNTSPSVSDVTTLISTSISNMDTISLRNTAITTNNATNLTLSNTFTNDINTFKTINISGNVNLVTNSTNTKYGYLAMTNANLSGINNTSFGSNSMLFNLSGNHNTAVGYYALSSNITNQNNTAFGKSALYSSQADNNTGIGVKSLTNLTTGINNTSIGCNSGKTVSTGNYNTFLGSNTSASISSISSSTAIGYNSKITTSNQTILGTSSESVYIPGTIYNSCTSIISTTTLTLSTSMYYFIANGSSSISINLPTSADNGVILSFRRMASSSGSITINYTSIFASNSIIATTSTTMNIMCNLIFYNGSYYVTN